MGQGKCAFSAQDSSNLYTTKAKRGLRKNSIEFFHSPFVYSLKSFAKDLKTIYTAADEEAARKQLKTVTEKWSGQYPSAMNRWHDNWDAISPIFKFSKEVRTAFYTTNAIESLNSCYRRLNKQRSVFPSSQALLKALYLGNFEIAKKWTMPIRNWGKVRGELEIMYPDRMQIQQ